MYDGNINAFRKAETEQIGCATVQLHTQMEKGTTNSVACSLFPLVSIVFDCVQENNKLFLKEPVNKLLKYRVLNSSRLNISLDFISYCVKFAIICL